MLHILLSSARTKRLRAKKTEMTLAIREAETAGLCEQRIGTWSAQGVLSQWVKEPDDHGAPGWREYNPRGGPRVAGGAGGAKKADLWVTFHTEERGPYGGAPEVFALVGGQRVEGVQLE